MKVLGVVPSSTGIRWAMLAGTRTQPLVVPLPSKGPKLPKDEDEGRLLQSLYRLLKTALQEQEPERVCILQAGNSQYGGPSAARIKTEAVLQLVGADLPVPTTLVPVLSLRAQEKKFSDIAGRTPEEVFNAGAAFSPKDWKDAVLVGWWGLDP